MGPKANLECERFINTVTSLRISDHYSLMCVAVHSTNNRRVRCLLFFPW